ncbi:bifunctional DNA primase/polymerase [uncultured Roseibium sp.]|uniref:bifunctional DNA primase/polymerase n=1 Tax=uncultured Roseibium sp. TaxID=1936171 RepID=UPI002617627D|nr:bifunctional DNA primase/polymerase [uncultured Roseibium sp.]
MDNIDELFEDAENIFRNYDPLYDGLGFSCTPVERGDKKPLVKGWTKKKNMAASEREELRQKYPNASIGVLADTPLPNGNVFGFVDVDHPGFTEFSRRLTSPVSSKIGQKGITTFCQFKVGTKSKKVRQKGANAPTIELMASSGMTVLPPSRHPYGVRYRWEGKPLYEVDPCDLPVLGDTQIELLAKVGSHPAALAIAEGGPDLKAHDLMLALTSSGIAILGLDLKWMAHCLNGLLPEGYRGNTADETLGMLESARAKQLGGGDAKNPAYDPGELGPIPLGYLSDGRFVLFEQTRHLVIVETSTRLMSVGTLLNLAPAEFWQKSFPAKKGIDVPGAAITLISAGRAKGGFDESTVRGRGVYVENGQVIRNFGGNIPSSANYTYVCPIPLRIEADGKQVGPAAVLRFLQLFNFASPSAAYLLFGWLASAVICGALDWRTHVFITGAKNTGKTTLVNALRNLIDKIVVALDGQSTEAGIRQKLGPDSRPVMLDEFESDQNLGRMRAVIKLIRSASSGNLAIARGTPEGKALEFNIRASFLLAAINPMAVTAADRSRIVNLALKKHDNDTSRARQIAELSQQFEDTSANWCLGAMDLTAEILASIKTLQRVFPPCDSRHALNMSTLLGAAWTMLNNREIDEQAAEALIQEHFPIIDELAEAHEQDDAIECWNALLEYAPQSGGEVQLLGEVLAEIKKLSKPNRDRHNDGNSLQSLTIFIERLGMKWEGNGLIVANSHRALKDVYRGTQWEAGNWADSLRRLPGAEATKQKRFSEKVRSLGTFIPAEQIPDWDKPELKF